MPAVDEILDGYRLIRLIGSGGFGDVWLCRMESTGEYRALKFLLQSRVRHLDRELEALKVYRREIGRNSARHLVAIEHINRREDGLFYVMPLADGPPGLDCEAEDWKPVTLATLSENRRLTPAWFSAEEVASIFAPLAMAAQTLAEAGLVHRDIKPQNILFFGGEPRLADIGLVSEDEAVLSQMGTPGYAAPQWYVATQGSPDMWGLAATLYHFATGNHPDYMSRPAYRWPPGGKQVLTASDQKVWLALIGVIYRATRENPAERYLQFRDMAAALNTLLPDRRGKMVGRPFRKTLRAISVGLAALAVIVAATVLLKIWPYHSLASIPTPKAKSDSRQPSTALAPSPTPKAKVDSHQQPVALESARKPEARPKSQPSTALAPTPTPKAKSDSRQPSTALAPTPTPKAIPDSHPQFPALTSLLPPKLKQDSHPQFPALTSLLPPKLKQDSHPQFPALTSLLPPKLKQDSHPQPTALASTPTPKAKQEPDQHPVPFEKQVETATADFETLLKNRRHALLGDRPMSHEPVDTFEKLINQLKTKKGAPMAELRNIYTQMEALGPAFNQGLHLINAHKLGEVVDELKAAALRPRQLAKNDDEVQQAGKISDRLLAEVSELQDEAIKQNSWVSYKIDTLKENLRDTTPKIAYARETDRKPDTGVYVGQAEGSELRGLSETVISKVLTPILHSDEAR